MKDEERRMSCNKWFRKSANGNLVFVPYACAMDYYNNYPVITGYGSKYPSEMVDDVWVDDATMLIRHRLEMEAEGRIMHSDMDAVVESIENISRVIDPKMINLTVKECYDLKNTPIVLPPLPPIDESFD